MYSRVYDSVSVVYDSRDSSWKPVSSPSVWYSLTHPHRSIGYRNRNPQPLTESVVRLIYLRVYDNRDTSSKPGPSLSVCSSLKHAHITLPTTSSNDHMHFHVQGSTKTQTQTFVYIDDVPVPSHTHSPITSPLLTLSLSLHRHPFLYILPNFHFQKRSLYPVRKLRQVSGWMSPRKTGKVAGQGDRDLTWDLQVGTGVE